MTASRAFKRPASVLVLVCTRAGDVLLMERVRPSGFWQSVTGSLEWGESVGSAASRELREETGLRAENRLINLRRGERFPIVRPWRSRYDPSVRFNREHWFVLELPARQMVRLQRAEHRQYRWMSAGQAMRRASSWTNRKLIRHWLSTRGRGTVFIR